MLHSCLGSDLVAQEVGARHREELEASVQRAASAWEKLRGKTVDDPGDFPSPDVDAQVTVLRQRLKEPRPGVQVLLYEDLSGVDVKEVVRRGVNRVRPANDNDEELRDVVL